MTWDETWPGPFRDVGRFLTEPLRDVGHFVTYANWTFRDGVVVSMVRFVTALPKHCLENSHRF